MEEIIIKEKRSKTIGLTFLGLLMLACCVFVFFMAIQELNIFFIATGFLGLLFFGACFIFILKRVINPKPLIIINEKGVTDYSTAMNVGLITWNNITNIRKQHVVNSCFIVIDVKDLSLITSKMTKFQKLLVKLNSPLKSSISLCANTADKKVDEIILLINESFNKYR